MHSLPAAAAAAAAATTTPSPPALTSYLALPLLQSKYSSANKRCRSHGGGLKTHIRKKVKKKKKNNFHNNLTGSWQMSKSRSRRRSDLGIAAFNLNVGRFIAVCFVHL